MQNQMSALCQLRTSLAARTEIHSESGLSGRAHETGSQVPVNFDQNTEVIGTRIRLQREGAL